MKPNIPRPAIIGDIVRAKRYKYQSSLITKIRNRHKLTQIQLGNMFGYKTNISTGRSLVCNIERGARSIPKSVYEIVATLSSQKELFEAINRDTLLCIHRDEGI